VTPRDAQLDEAARWLLIQRDGRPSATQREEFLAWLRESPQHVAAYLSVAGTADTLAVAVRGIDVDAESLVAEAAAEESPVVAFPRGAQAVAPRSAKAWAATRDPARPPAARRRRALAGALAASVALAAVVIGWRIASPPSSSPLALATAHGEQGSWPLADGSVVHLNSDSAALVLFDRTARRVELQRGQAMFHVAADPARPFRVQAGAVEVVAVGTAFDVDRRDGRATLVVVEGRVAVNRAGRASLAVPAGLRLDLAAADASPVPADVRRATAWLQREIVFEATPLAEVADEFNRYTAVPIAVEGAALRGLPISGVFGAYDVDSFLAFLARLDGVAIERRPDRVRVYPRPVTPPAGRRSESPG
jgi:transmembrane sensor